VHAQTLIDNLKELQVIESKRNAIRKGLVYELLNAQDTTTPEPTTSTTTPEPSTSTTTPETPTATSTPELTTTTTTPEPTKTTTTPEQTQTTTTPEPYDHYYSRADVTVPLYRSGDMAWTVGDHGSRAYKKEDCCNTGSVCVH
jgi:hypothetical protein